MKKPIIRVTKWLTRGIPELSPQTFCTFRREFSSVRRQGVGTPSNFVPKPGSADPARATCDSPFAGLLPRNYKPAAVRSDSRSTLHGHAAAYG